MTARNPKTMKGTRVMMGLIIFLLAIWLLVAAIGIAVKGLLWLGIVGLALLVVTTAFGAVLSTR